MFNSLEEQEQVIKHLQNPEHFKEEDQQLTVQIHTLKNQLDKLYEKAIIFSHISKLLESTIEFIDGIPLRIRGNEISLVFAKELDPLRWITINQNCLTLKVKTYPYEFAFPPIKTKELALVIAKFILLKQDFYLCKQFFRDNILIFPNCESLLTHADSEFRNLAREFLTFLGKNYNENLSIT